MDAGTLELVDLEEILNADMTCGHIHGNCQVDVVCITHSCVSELFGCVGARAHYVDALATGLNCKRCHRPVRMCWSVRPI